MFKHLIYGRPEFENAASVSVYEVLKRDPSQHLLQFDEQLQRTRWFKSLSKELAEMTKENGRLNVRTDFNFVPDPDDPDPRWDNTPNVGLMCARYLAGIRGEKQTLGNFNKRTRFLQRFAPFDYDTDAPFGPDQSFDNPTLAEVMPTPRGDQVLYNDAKKIAKIRRDRMRNI